MKLKKKIKDVENNLESEKRFVAKLKEELKVKDEIYIEKEKDLKAKTEAMEERRKKERES